jgi:prevent-host-death family protein
MPKIKLSEDVRPLSEFRAQMAAMLDQVRETGRPLVLTERGRSAAVVVGIETYEALLDELELLRDVRKGEKQIDAGRGISQGKAKAVLKKRLRRVLNK